MKFRLIALGALMATAVTANAGVTVMGDLGEYNPDSNRSKETPGLPTSRVSHMFTLGGSLGYNWDNGWGAELDYQAAGKTNLDSSHKWANIRNTSVNGYYEFMPEATLKPYVLGGLGREATQTGLGTLNNNIVNLGLGAFYDFPSMPALSLRGEVRAIHAMSGSDGGYAGVTNGSHNDLMALLGLQYEFGKASGPAPMPAPAPAPEPAPQPMAAPVAPPPPAVVDSDGDGVPDTADQCPNTPHGVQVDGRGCPLDADRDGVPDYKDKCPNTPAGVQVDAEGCPIDSDADGVPDYLDKCPNTPAGAKVDEKGCPVMISEAIKQQVNVLFDNGKAVVKPEYKDEVKKVADLAKEYPTAFIEIQGYTDNRGSKAKNTKLSQQRADAVRDMLVKEYGVDAAHITSKGYGPASPVADNKTEAGRAANRRVIAVLTAEQKKMQMGAPVRTKHHHKAAPAH